MRALAALGLFVLGCDAGSAASPTFLSVEAGAPESEDASSYLVCPPGMDASFGSIYSAMLSTSSCGSANNSCHNATGAMNSNLLNYSLDASAVYAELLGADGGGHGSANAAGSDRNVLRIVPFDAGASMLYIKITLDSGTNPTYGAGMPWPGPASVCPAAVSAVEDWINAGAPQN